jgi:16S rRNA (guanine966-N2)-methyltransferase
MRIVAGSAGGIPLQSPNATTRPTMDRVKAAIFSSLAEKIPGARVLDLFAGSGALGIEALSRGAASASFVDSNPDAAECISRNLEKARLSGAIFPMSSSRFLERIARENSFDLIFADPPYVKDRDAHDFGAELLRGPSLARALADDGIFVLETSPSQTLPDQLTWEVVRRRRYGAAESIFFRKLLSQ